MSWRDLALEIAAEGGGRFDGINWEVSRHRDVDTISQHERLHRQLNDITSYGCLLDALARLVARGADSDRFAVYLRRLVSRCRTTHEAFATFLSLRPAIDLGAPLASLAENTEYLGYYRYAEHFAGLVPSRPLGVLILSAAVRISMNGPLPEKVETGDFVALALSDFRAADAPDIRFLQCRKHLDKDFWARAVADARESFSGHPHWYRYLEPPLHIFRPLDFFDLQPLGDSALVRPARVSSSFETDVGNFLLDQAALNLRTHGVETY